MTQKREKKSRTGDEYNRSERKEVREEKKSGERKTEAFCIRSGKGIKGRERR